MRDVYVSMYALIHFISVCVYVCISSFDCSLHKVGEEDLHALVWTVVAILCGTLSLENLNCLLS